MSKCYPCRMVHDTDHAAFAASAQTVASALATELHGRHFVFISTLWAAMQERRLFEGTITEFKSRLLAAYEERMISLVKADMPQIFDSAALAASRTPYRTEAFVFVSVE